MSIKSKDLAKLLGVSTATISLVLNNKPGISPSLRKKLTDQITELGYGEMLAAQNETSDQSASSDMKKHTIIYAIYSAKEDNADSAAFYPAVLEGTEMQARDEGYNIQVVHLGDCTSCKLKNCINPDESFGIIAQVEFVTDRIFRDLHETRLPFILVDCYNYSRNISSVCVNNEDGIFQAVKYLKQYGHTNIGYIASGSDTDSFLERRRCYHQALREFKLEDRTEFRFFASGSDCESCHSLVNQWRNMAELPTALIVENDILAAQAIKAIKKIGLKVPEDISIVGFDDRSVARLTDPALTTIRVQRHLMGRQSVILLQNLIKMIETGFHGVPYRMSVGVTLIERESVAKPDAEVIRLIK